jgi:hypothetical protein
MPQTSPDKIVIDTCLPVDLRGRAFLQWSAHHPRRLQEGSPLRSKNHRGASQDQPEARHPRAGKDAPLKPSTVPSVSLSPNSEKFENILRTIVTYRTTDLYNVGRGGPQEDWRPQVPGVLG